MDNIKWIVTLGIAVDLDVDSDENPWYKETCELDAPEDIEVATMRELAALKIIPELGSVYQECIHNIWLIDSYPKEEDDEWNEEDPDPSIQ